MPDWLSHLAGIVVTALFTGGGVAAIAKYLLDSQAAKHRNQREQRADEIDVLQGVIAGLQTRVAALEAELTRQRDGSDKALRESRDAHTACLQREGLLEGRVSHLEAEVERLAGVGGKP